MRTILLISPYWKEPHRWMVSSYKLAELWQRLGYRVIAVCMGKETKVEKISETLTVHYRKDLFLPDPLNFGIAFGFTGYVRRVIREEKPDLIVCNKLLFWSSFSVIALRLTGHKILVLTDALVGITWWPRAWWPKVLAVIEAWTFGWAVMLCAERLVTFFPQPEKLLKRMGVWKKTSVIPTGIDPGPYSRTPNVNASSPLPRPEPSEGLAGEGGALRARRERENELGGIVITYVGRLESVKGADDFLAAATPLKKNYPQLKVQVVGWYKDGHPLVKQYQDQVTFTGLRDDIPAILSETDIFVMPSYSEGLSNAIMEAMSSSCACIATEVGGNAFLIQNGVSGFLFTPGDRAELQAHIRRLIDDPAKRKMMGQAARKRIDEQFSWEVVGKMYQRLFASL